MADNLLVNRNGQTYQVDMTNTASIEPTDLLLVNRDGTTYTVTGDKISTGGSLETVTLAPLSGTPNFEITAVTDINSIPEGATARYRWYRYDEASGDAGKTLLQDSILTTTNDSYLAVATEQGKFVGCTVTYLGVSVTDTQRVQCSTADVPIARMNALRFGGNDRRTTLKTPLVTSDEAWTFSFWIKPTNTSSAYVFNNRPSSSNDEMVVVWNNDYLEINYFNQPRFYVPCPNNKWTHIVWNYNGTGAADASKVWADGDFIQSGSVSGVTELDAPFYFGRPSTAMTNLFDGYLSDFYYVDKRALAPEKFGKEYLLGWGPLDQSEVLANIGKVDLPTAPISPYETRPNMDEKWSDGTITGDTSYVGAVAGPPSAFDGDLSTTWVPTTDGASPGGEQTLTFTNPITCTKCEIYAYRENDSRSLKVNGNDTYSLFSPQSEKEWHDVSSLLTDGKLISLTTDYPSGSSSGIGAVRCDGRILVDGPLNNSQNWSDIATVTEGIVNSNRPLSMIFDNDWDTGSEIPSGTTTSTEWPVGAISGSKIRVGTYLFSSSYIYFNDNPDHRISASNTGWNDITDLFGITSITKITQVRAPFVQARHDCMIRAIEVDDVELFDGGYQWNTSENWSNKTSYTGTIYRTPDADSDFTPEYAFDGDLRGSGSGTGIGPYRDGTMTLTHTFSGAHDFKFYTGLQPGGTIKFDGATVYTNDTGSLLTPNTPIEVSGTDVNSITWVSNSGNDNTSYMFGISVDGQILVDGPAAWNTSRVWSDGVDVSTIKSWTAPENAFDGYLPRINSEITGDAAYGIGADVGGAAVWNVKVPSGVTKLTVHALLGLDTANVKVTVDVNGTLTEFGSGYSSFANFDVPVASNNEVSVSARYISGDDYAYLLGFSFDDELLVDAGSFGDNGFFLPFDPEATPVYNLGELTGGPAIVGHEPSKLFIPDLDTSFAGASGTPSLFTFDTPITATSTIKMWATQTGGAHTNWTYNGIDGSNATNLTNNGGNAWDLMDLGVKQLDSVSVGSISSLGYILADDVAVVDTSNIGIDASGNKRNFYPENFAAGNTSRVWSSGDSVETGSNDAWGDNTFWTGAFNGSLLVAPNTNAAYYVNGYATLTLPETLTGDFTVYARYGSSTGDNSASKIKLLNFDNQELAVIDVGSTSQSAAVVQFDVGELTDVAKIRIGSGDGSAPLLYGVSVDGSLLVDANVKDGVIDSPMSNYATLTQGKNGWLESDGSTGNGSYECSQEITTGKYYWEAQWRSGNGPALIHFKEGGFGPLFDSNGSPSQISVTFGSLAFNQYDIIGIALDADSHTFDLFVNSVHAATATIANPPAKYNLYGGSSIQVISHNYGQQGFNNAFITENPDGTVTALNQTPNTEYVWTNGVSGVSTIQNPGGGFDGNTATKTESAGGLSWTAAGAGSSPINFLGKVEVFGDVVLNYRANGGAWVSPSGNGTWVTVAEGPGNLSSINAIRNDNDGWDAGWYAVRVDGRILVDNDPSINASRFWSASMETDGTYESTSGNGSPAAAFDNDPSTRVVTNETGKYIKVNFSPPLAGECLVITNPDRQYKVNGNTVSVDNTSGLRWRLLGTFDTINSIEVAGSSVTPALHSVKIDNKILVDSLGFPGGIYNKLYQTWTDQQAVVFQARIASADLLMAALRDHAQPYSATEDYCEGTVISAFGQLWISVADAPATAFADKPALLAHPNWEQLNVSV